MGMGSSKINVNAQGQATPRTGFSYDMTVRQLDASFWKTITGAGAMASNKLRLNADTLASYTQFKYGRFQFLVNVPTTLSAGEAKKWGLLSPGNVAAGSAYFEIVGAVLNAVSYDDDGTAQTTAITTSFPGAAAEYLYEIEWEDDYVIFSISGTVVASHQTRVGTHPLPLYLHNADADNTDFGNITIKETAQYV